jgi:hypothetical protein
MIKLNEKVQALIDLLELEVDTHNTYVIVYLNKEQYINIELHEGDDIEYVKKTIFNNLYRSGRNSYKNELVEDFRYQADDFDSPLCKLVYDYKNPFE